jgi:hypothetical protein
VQRFGTDPTRFDQAQPRGALDHDPTIRDGTLDVTTPRDGIGPALETSALPPVGPAAYVAGVEDEGNPVFGVDGAGRGYQGDGRYRPADFLGESPDKAPTTVEGRADEGGHTVPFDSGATTAVAGDPVWVDVLPEPEPDPDEAHPAFGLGEGVAGEWDGPDLATAWPDDSDPAEPTEVPTLEAELEPTLEPDPPPAADVGDAFGAPADAPAAVEGIEPAADPDDALLPTDELGETGFDADPVALTEPVMVDVPYVPEAVDPVTEADPVLADPDPPFDGYGEPPSDADLAFEH